MSIPLDTTSPASKDRTMQVMEQPEPDLTLSPALSRLYAQLNHRTGLIGIDEIRTSNNSDDLAAEIKAIALYLERNKVSEIGDIKITPLRIGPAPDRCEACGKKLP